MCRIVQSAGLVALGLLILSFAVVGLGTARSDAPSPETCVALWNAPDNALGRARVAAHDFESAQIEGAFVEGRYEGCFAWFVQGTGEPWALYSAMRVPGENRPLRWVIDLRGQRWGIDFPEPEPKPQPNASVLEDGSLSLHRGRERVTEWRR
jgi:hypothetical protein